MNGRALYETPASRIFTVVAVVAENKEAPFRNHERSPVVSRWMVPAMSARDQVMRLPVHARMDGVAKTVDVTSVRFGNLNPVEVKHFPVHLQCIPGNANESLHIAPLGIVRRVEDDHVLPPRLAESRQTQSRSRDLSSEQDLGLRAGNHRSATCFPWSRWES